MEQHGVLRLVKQLLQPGAAFLAQGDSSQVPVSRLLFAVAMNRDPGAVQLCLLALRGHSISDGEIGKRGPVGEALDSGMLVNSTILLQEICTHYPLDRRVMACREMV